MTLSVFFDIIMLLYSWKKIFYSAQGKPREILRIIRMLTYQELPFSKRDKIYKFAETDFRGDSFLVHPDVLLYNAYKHDPRDLAIYIALASLRSSGAYFAQGVQTLDLLHSPVDVKEKLRDPSLLHVEDGKIHFLYEEVDNQTKH